MRFPSDVAACTAAVSDCTTFPADKQLCFTGGGAGALHVVAIPEVRFEPDILCSKMDQEIPHHDFERVLLMEEQNELDRVLLEARVCRPLDKELERVGRKHVFVVIVAKGSFGTAV